MNNFIIQSLQAQGENKEFTFSISTGVYTIPYVIKTETITLLCQEDQYGLLDYTRAKALYDNLLADASLDWTSETYGLLRTTTEYAVGNDPDNGYAPGLISYEVTGLCGTASINLVRPGVYTVSVTDVRKTFIILDKIGSTQS